MPNQEQYISEFNKYAQEAIVRNDPWANLPTSEGQLARLKAFASGMQEKIETMNTELVGKANELLKNAESDDQVNAKSLREELFELGKAAIENFIGKYKPK